MPRCIRDWFPGIIKFLVEESQWQAEKGQRRGAVAAEALIDLIKRNKQPEDFSKLNVNGFPVLAVYASLGISLIELIRVVDLTQEERDELLKEIRLKR